MPQTALQNFSTSILGREEYRTHESLLQTIAQEIARDNPEFTQEEVDELAEERIFEIQGELILAAQRKAITQTPLVQDSRFPQRGGPAAVMRHTQSHSSDQADIAPIQHIQNTTEVMDQSSDGVAPEPLPPDEHQNDARLPRPDVENELGRPRRNPPRAARGAGNRGNNRHVEEFFQEDLSAEIGYEDEDEDEDEDEEEENDDEADMEDRQHAAGLEEQSDEEEEDDQSDILDDHYCSEDEVDDENPDEIEENDQPNKEILQLAPGTANRSPQPSPDIRHQSTRGPTTRMIRPIPLALQGPAMSFRRHASGVQSRGPRRAQNPGSFSSILQLASLAHDYDTARAEEEVFRKGLGCHLQEGDSTRELVSRALEARGRRVARLLEQSIAEDEEAAGNGNRNNQRGAR